MSAHVQAATDRTWAACGPVTVGRTSPTGPRLATALNWGIVRTLEIALVQIVLGRAYSPDPTNRGLQGVRAPAADQRPAVWETFSAWTAHSILMVVWPQHFPVVPALAIDQDWEIVLVTGLA